MTLENILLLIGWFMLITPFVMYLFITTRIVIGAARDDSTIMALISLGLTIAAIGGGVLLIVYLTDLLV